MMSVLLRPPPERVPITSASLITSAFALAVREACTEQSAVDLSLKWPNDLVVELGSSSRDEREPGYRKVAGILTEAVIRDDSVDAMVIGMGLNTGLRVVPDHLALVATSLNLLSGASVDRMGLARRILEFFEHRYAFLLEDGGLEAVAAEANQFSATVGRRVRITRSSGQPVVGEAVEVDECGRLVVRRDDGTHEIVVEGDVIHLRPAFSEP